MSLFSRKRKLKPGTNVIIVVVTAAGASSRKEATVEPTMTIAEVLAQAKINPKGMEISVDGKPVTDFSQKIGGGTNVEVTSPEPKRVTVSERASGS